MASPRGTRNGPASTGALENVASEAPLQTGGGGGTFDGMEVRVTALEKQFEKIDGKLDKILGELSSTRADISFLKGRVETIPSSKDFGELKGRVDSLPTMARMTALLSVVAVVILILNNWSTIKASLIH
jgi:hypothetical protein